MSGSSDTVSLFRTVQLREVVTAQRSCYPGGWVGGWVAGWLSSFEFNDQLKLSLSRSITPLAISLSLNNVKFCINPAEFFDIHGFNLSGKYYSMKSSPPYASRKYLLNSLETVIEFSLQEVKESFDEVDTRLNHIQKQI